MVQANLLTPPSRIPPKTALQLSQKAPLILSSAPTSSLPWPLSLLFSRETPETWAIHENLLLAALRTGDDAAARQILDRLTTRFGAENERMVALKGVYDEALAKDDRELEKVFNDYETVLKQDPTNFSVRKRRVAILKSLGRTADAITALTVLLDNSPTDAEAWAELSELYASNGAWGQAIFCLEEVLLMMPNAWSVRLPLEFLPSPRHGQLTLSIGARSSSHTPLSLCLFFPPRTHSSITALCSFGGIERLVSSWLLRLETCIAKTHSFALGRAFFLETQCC